jgi:hypothetical protein
MFRLLIIFAVAYGASSFSVQAAPTAAKDDSPIPILGFQDVNALYTSGESVSREHFPGDWNYPKLKNYPHQKELIERCKLDWSMSMEKTPDPFHNGRALPPGELRLLSVTKDPKNRIVYFNFEYDSQLVSDVWIIYYYDPHQDRFILKSRR